LIRGHQRALPRKLARPRRRYQRPTHQEQEEILALYATTGSQHEVSRLSGWSRDVIRRVLREAEDSGVLWERRLAQQERYVDLAWQTLMLALQTVQDGLRKGCVSGTSVNEGGEPAAVLQPSCQGIPRRCTTVLWITSPVMRRRSSDQAQHKAQAWVSRERDALVRDF
jgi:hypothetical protein